MSLVIVACIVVGIMLVVFAWLTPFKQYRQSGTGDSVAESAQMATESFSQDIERNALTAPFQFAISQTYAAQYVVTYPRFYPASYPFLKGESAVMTVSEIVPRFLYPSKPDVGLYINRLAYYAELRTFESLGVSSQAIDMISEFYINFGTLGVFVLSIVHGFYHQARYDWLIRRSDPKLGFPIYAAGFLSWAAFWNYLVLDLKNWMVWIPALWLLSHRIRKPTTQPAQLKLPNPHPHMQPE